MTMDPSFQYESPSKIFKTAKELPEGLDQHDPSVIQGHELKLIWDMAHQVDPNRFSDERFATMKAAAKATDFDAASARTLTDTLDEAVSCLREHFSAQADQTLTNGDVIHLMRMALGR